MFIRGISRKLSCKSVIQTLCLSQLHTTSWLMTTNMELKQVVSKLQVLAPTSLAESWDNVGLLIEPSTEKIVKASILPPKCCAVIQKIMQNWVLCLCSWIVLCDVLGFWNWALRLVWGLPYEHNIHVDFHYIRLPSWPMIWQNQFWMRPLKPQQTWSSPTILHCSDHSRGWRPSHGRRG